MCRWLSYSGSPVLLEELLYGPENSLVVQSLHPRLGAEETNGDGFGIGWYGRQDAPAIFHSIEPAGTTAICGSSPATSGRRSCSRTSEPRRAPRFSRRIVIRFATGDEHGVESPFQGTIATTDGECVWAFRYSSEGRCRSLFFSTDVRTLRAICPGNELLRDLG
jgi:hypothetical protein